MESFIDINGEVWNFPEFNLGLIKRIKREAGVDLLSDKGKSAADDAGEWYAMLYDPEKLGALLFVIFQSVIEKKQLSDDQYAELLSGKSLDQARKAVIASLINFIHSETVAAAMQAELPNMQNRADKLLIARWKNTVGNSLEKLESTPPSSP